MTEWEIKTLLLAAVVVGLWLLLVIFYVTYCDVIDKGKGSSEMDGGKRRARPPHNVEK